MTSSSYSSNNKRNSSNESYYDILGIPAYTSDAKVIRQGYLKQAVKYHPDKNPDQPFEAKERFVLIGHAYEVLSDNNKRSQYNHDLKWGRTTSSNNTNSYNSSSTDYASSDGYNDDINADDIEQVFRKYRNAFDQHVANMSESEINAVVGLASMVGGILGSVLGSHLANSAAAGTGSSSSSRRGCGSISSAAPTGSSVLLSTLGSMAGSLLSSHAAAETVRTIHQQSVERVAYGQQQQGPDYVQNSKSDRNTRQQRQQSPPNSTSRSSNNNNTSSTGTNNDPTITLDDVASAVNAGMRLWQAYKAHKSNI